MVMDQDLKNWTDEIRRQRRANDLFVELKMLRETVLSQSAEIKRLTETIERQANEIGLLRSKQPTRNTRGRGSEPRLP